MAAVAGWLWAIAAQAQVVDRLAAVVGGATVVTTSDVEIEASLASLDPAELPFWRHGDPEERLVDAALVRLAAADVSLYQPTPDAVRARVAAIRASFATAADGDAWIARWGLDDAALAVLVRRRMVVERYLLRNLTVSPTNETAWLAEMHDLVSQLESRIPVRRVAPGTP